ncbi:hypothetical protein [Paenibacillus rigui]|uniref:Uncharacterized protein n=1 Tax=Paenibacillus rigui TaxID=554312 RepID=A0A229UXN8_9BACL|nr:hypothetical protein [Paenibacillus rigui]OXM88214.1 hypothetical protein CF651_03750 [Paenibacillus rigui]
MKQYAEKSKQKVKDLDDNTEYQFIVTFKKPISENELKAYTGNLNKPMIYGRGIDNEGNRITTLALSVDEDAIKQVKENPKYTFKGFTQIDAVATGAENKKLLNDNAVFSVEAANNFEPLGLFWKLEEQE